MLDKAIKETYFVPEIFLICNCRDRLKFLSKYKQAIKPTIERSMSWTLVDENREEVRAEGREYRLPERGKG